MTGRLSVLARVVAASPEQFASQIWARRPHLSRAAELPGAFTDLLDLAAVDELISRRGLRTPFLRMAKDGTVLGSGRFTRSGGIGATISDQVADDLVLHEFADGATLVLQALHRTWPPLVAFGSELAAALGHPVQVNAYVTPPQNQGFAPHYDTHDVFVLQVAGRKHWHVHEPVLDSPLTSQPWDARTSEVAAAAAGPAVLEAVLEPGDALYLPRGHLHSASALGETSLHLTVGVHPVTRARLVEHLLAIALDDPELRASLPVGQDLGDPAVLAEHLHATLDVLHRRLDAVGAARVAERIAADLVRDTRPEPIAPLRQLAAAEAAGPATRVRLRAGLRCRSDEDGTLHAGAARIMLPPSASDAVKVLVAGGIVTAAQLPGLDASEQLVVVRRLLREGVLVPAEPA